MTRINVGIAPEELPSKLLLAEHRELTRIPNAIKRGIKTTAIPTDFCLGTGHVRFFYNKLLYLKIRYELLYLECLARGFSITPKFESFVGLPEALLNDYEATDTDRQLIVNRIHSKGFSLLTQETYHAKDRI